MNTCTGESGGPVLDSLLPRHADVSVPRPERWGGYRVAPTRVEFWQGRTSRLHDRLVFSRPADTEPWRVERLQP
jgi:pyridoxamine 5'-phosphate oxidase